MNDVKTSLEYIPPPLQPDEELGRRVLSSSDFKIYKEIDRKTGKVRLPKVKPNAFKEKNRMLSSDRLGEASLDHFADLGNADARRRSERTGTDRRFYGWGVITVDDAECNRRVVKCTPKDDNCFHVDIILPPDASHDDVRQMHAAQLARVAKWLPKPS